MIFFAKDYRRRQRTMERQFSQKSRFYYERSIYIISKAKISLWMVEIFIMTVQDLQVEILLSKVEIFMMTVQDLHNDKLRLHNDRPKCLWWQVEILLSKVEIFMMTYNYGIRLSDILEIPTMLVRVWVPVQVRVTKS